MLLTSLPRTLTTTTTTTLASSSSISSPISPSSRVTSQRSLHAHSAAPSATTATTNYEYPPLPSLNLPSFADLNPRQLNGELDSLLKSLESDVVAIEQLDPSSVPFMEVVSQLDAVSERLESVFSPFRHLDGVQSHGVLREATFAALPKVVKFGMRISQSEALYRIFKYFSENPKGLSQVHLRVVESYLKSAELSGVSLTGSKKMKFSKNAQRLSLLGNKFAENVLDNTKALNLTVDLAQSPHYSALIQDLPLSLKSQAHSAYAALHPKSTGTIEEGPWTFTLDHHVFISFMERCSIRELRKELYDMFISRCSSGKWDNRATVAEILTLRGEQANLLGMKNYGEMSFAQKMAKDRDDVLSLSNTVLSASRVAAEKEMAELQKHADTLPGSPSSLLQWDLSYFSRSLKESLFNFSEEEVKKYLPYDSVMKGLFQLSSHLFDIEVVKHENLSEPNALSMFRFSEDDRDIQKWNSDVEFFYIYQKGKGDEPIAAFYLDPFARPSEKRGGAWMDVCKSSRYVDGKQVQIPVAYLVCNSSPATATSPAVLTFREVETLFHEFGHGLQHMLTTVEVSHVAGINGVEWDAVELPSQFMENWCYHKETFLSLTHTVDGEPFPVETFEKIKRSQTFMAGSMYLRQLTFGLTDLDLHTLPLSSPVEYESVRQVQRDVMKRTQILPSLLNDHSLCSFAHIFAGGYACGYYSYLWAKILSADAFEQFVVAGLDDPEAVKKTGKRFRDTVLALGGSKPPAEVFKMFTNSDPNPRSLLKHEGLLAEE
eukprot:TRINITY_DN6940_c0_g1_i1.p1 TRINITY_DN6940_c0_g1~~TRINITY_DN6940_c0_g1_i1.p1  ORF type:complete len:773 (+),score=176.77 TRINITY_DN6940_c0_g1_i1:31-2349(+)